MLNPGSYLVTDGAVGWRGGGRCGGGSGGWWGGRGAVGWLWGEAVEQWADGVVGEGGGGTVGRWDGASESSPREDSGGGWLEMAPETGCEMEKRASLEQPAPDGSVATKRETEKPPV